MGIRRVYTGLGLTALTASLALSGMSAVPTQTSVAAHHGEASATVLRPRTAESISAPVVGMAATPNGGGYWLVGADGGVYSFGDAQFYGSTYSDGLTGLSGSHPLGGPIVGMAATPNGGGYWLVGADGGVYSFGDAQFYGSTYSDGLTGLSGSHPLGGPIVGMAATPNGGGYWLVGADGGVYSFGDAQFYGSTYSDGITGLGGSRPLGGRVVGVTATPNGGGYWLVGADGGVYSFGDASYEGNAYTQGFSGLGGSNPLARPVVGVGGDGTEDGYWLAASDGGVFSFGSADFHGSVPQISPPAAQPQSYSTPNVASLANPSANLPDSFYQTCANDNAVSGPNSYGCQVAAIAAINQAHAAEGIPPLQLPNNYYSLTPAEQLFVLVNEERVERGLAPAVGMVAGLSGDALQGADSLADPPLGATSDYEGVPVYGVIGANWAEDYSIAASVFDWMYADGWAGGATTNEACTSAGAPGCWGHRENILRNLPGGAVVMGTASVSASNYPSVFVSDAMVLGTVSSPSSVPYTYTWADAVAQGA